MHPATHRGQVPSVRPSSPIRRPLALLTKVALASLAFAACDSGITAPISQEGGPNNEKGVPSAVALKVMAYSVGAGDVVPISATVKDQQGNVLFGASNQIAWTTSDTMVAVVDRSGKLQARTLGEVEVQAKVGNGRGSTRLKVRPSKELRINPGRTELNPSESVQLSATVVDSRGNETVGAPVQWESLNPNYAQVDSVGRVTALALGTALMTATAGNAVDTAAVDVIPVQAAAPPMPAPTPPGSTAPSPAELPRVLLDTRYAAPEGRLVNVPAGGSLQKALDDAQPGDQIVLQAGATYTGNFTLRPNSGTEWIVIRSSAELPPEGTRVSPADASRMPKILSPNSEPALKTVPGANRYRLMGLEVSFAPSVNEAYVLVNLGTANTTSQATLADVPRDLVVDRSYVHGHPGVAFQRCIALNSASTAVIDSYVSECHHKGFDSQAVSGSNGPGPFKIVNNYLEGAGENIMFGGSGAAQPEMAPADIEIRRNWVRKPPEWYPSVWSVKNLMELKSGQRVLVEGNVFENVWSESQTGYALLFKGDPGKNAQTHDITVRYNIIRNALSGVTLHPNPNGATGPQFMKRIYVGNNRFERMGKQSDYAASGGARMWQLLGPLTDVTVEDNTSLGSFDNQVMTEGSGKTRVRFRSNVVDQASYGVQGAADLAGRGDLTLTGNWLAPATWNDPLTGTNCIAPVDGSAPAACGAAGVDQAAVDAATAGVVKP